MTELNTAMMKRRQLTNYEVNINRFEGPNFPKGEVWVFLHNRLDTRSVTSNDAYNDVFFGN